MQKPAKPVLKRLRGLLYSFLICAQPTRNGFAAPFGVVCLGTPTLKAVGSNPAGRTKNPECDCVRGFYLFTIHFSLTSTACPGFWKEIVKKYHFNVPKAAAFPKEMQQPFFFFLIHFCRQIGLPRHTPGIQRLQPGKHRIPVLGKGPAVADQKPFCPQPFQYLQLLRQ